MSKIQKNSIDVKDIILIIIALIQTVILVKQFVDDDCDYQPDVTVNDRNHLGE